MLLHLQNWTLSLMRFLYILVAEWESYLDNGIYIYILNNMGVWLIYMYFD
jgi:hypothetical protein